MKRIIDKILTDCSLIKPTETKNFLEVLMNGTEYQKRLLICLGIDMFGELIEKNIMSNILNSLDYDKCLNPDEILKSYEKAIVNLGVFVSPIETNPSNKNILLARVMKASTFSAYFYPNIEGINDVNHDWKNVKNEIEKGNLENINVFNTSLMPRGLVWTTPLKELENIIKENLDNYKDPTNDIVNRLGLCTTASINNEYLYLEYDSLFDETIYKPNNLSNCWTDENSLYVSCITNDGFGRTRPRSGDAEKLRMKEAVHESISDSFKFKYTVKYLGTLDDFSLEILDFNSEAMKRLAS